MAFCRFVNPEIKNLFQWNKNIKLKFPNYEPGQEIHFSNNKETAYVLKLNENLEAQIPNELLEQTKPIEVYSYVEVPGTDTEYTKQRTTMTVIARPCPINFESGPSTPTPPGEVLKRYQGIENAGKVLVVDDDGYLMPTDFDLSGDKNYVYVQSSASNIWNINHNLDKFPSVTVVDTAGTVVIGETIYKNSSTIVVKFSAPFSGKAFLN